MQKIFISESSILSRFQNETLKDLVVIYPSEESFVEGHPHDGIVAFWLLTEEEMDRVKDVLVAPGRKS